MSTIDQFDKQVHQSYWQRTSTVEQIEQDIQISQSRAVSIHTALVNTTPQISALDKLLGLSLSQQETPWALFSAPEEYDETRNLAFFAAVFPSLMTWVQLWEKKERKRKKRNEKKEKKREESSEGKEEEEASTSENENRDHFVRLTQRLNKQLRFVRSRILQFLQC